MTDTINRIGLQFFADGGAEGSASGNGANGNGSGLTGDFSSDMERYFGMRPTGTDAAPGRGDTMDDGEIEQAETEPGSVTGTGDADAAASGQQEDNNAGGYDAVRQQYDKEIKADFQQAFNERFKEFKTKEQALQQQVDSYRQTMAPLLDKYGLSEDATQEQIAEAIKADNANFSRQAMQAGLSTDAYRENFYANQQKRAQEQAVAEQAAAQQQAAEQQQREEAMRKTYDAWQEQSKELQKNFPQFDLRAEVQGNERFRKLLEGGASVQEAYYGANFDRIASGLVAATRQQSVRDGAAAVANNRARPAEGGQTSGVGVRTGTDVANMTGDQIMALIARAERGEKIVL